MFNLEFSHALRGRPVRTRASALSSFAGEVSPTRGPSPRLLPVHGVDGSKRGGGTERRSRCTLSEQLVLFEAHTTSIPVPVAASPDKTANWNISDVPPDVIMFGSEAAPVERSRSLPCVRAAVAVLAVAVGLSPQLAWSREPSASPTALAMVTGETTGPAPSPTGPVASTEGLPQSVFDAVIGERVTLTLVDGMAVNGVVLAVDSDNVTFSVEDNGNVIALPRANVAGVKMLVAKTTGPESPEPTPSELESPENPLSARGSPEFEGLVRSAEITARGGLSWRAYLAYRDSLDHATPANRRYVVKEMQQLEHRMRRIGQGLWIPGTVLTVAGFGILSYPIFWVYGGMVLHFVGLPMLVVGSVMHSRANQIRRELPDVRDRYSRRARWNGGLSWSF